VAGEGRTVAGCNCIGFCCRAELLVGEDCHAQLGFADIVHAGWSWARLLAEERFDEAKPHFNFGSRATA
jgi:hypothetical protein